MSDIREFLTKESIAAYRNAVIEECARVADSYCFANTDLGRAPKIAAAIRALKDKL